MTSHYSYFSLSFPQSLSQVNSSFLSRVAEVHGTEPPLPDWCTVCVLFVSVLLFLGLVTTIIMVKQQGLFEEEDIESLVPEDHQPRPQAPNNRRLVKSSW